MNRRQFITTLGLGGLGTAVGTHYFLNETSFQEHDDSHLTELRNMRQPWQSGSFEGTRIRKDGKLVLDDITVLSDDFDWRNPNRSDFEWLVRDPGESRIRPHPEKSLVEFAVANPGEILELEQTNRRIDLTEHPDWRLNVVENSNSASVGNAWEFWFSTPPIGGAKSWVLIDAGGGGNVSIGESRNNSCGFGFKQRTDQLLASDYDYRLNPDIFFGSWLGPAVFVKNFFRSRVYCWDGFYSAPLDHRSTQKLSLELLGSEGQVNGYVNDYLEADLLEKDGQSVLENESVVVGVRFHYRGNSKERGYLHHLSLQKVGSKVRKGIYSETFENNEKSKWKFDLEYEGSEQTSVDIEFSKPDLDKWYSNLSTMKPTSVLQARLILKTEKSDETPVIKYINAEPV